MLGVQPISAYLYYSVFIPRLYLNQYRRIDKEKKKKQETEQQQKQKRKKKVNRKFHRKRNE